MGTGARALRTELETILSDAMFEAPEVDGLFLAVGYSLGHENEFHTRAGRFEHGVT
jgi:ATP-dependent Clp protease ATP-binding subunit ClpX